MHERELRAFVSTAESGRMDVAAKILRYSQPAVSYQIKCLEQSLGMKLFDRGCAGLRLTREGRMVLPSARAMLVLIDGIKRVGASGAQAQQPAAEPVAEPAGERTAARSALTAVG